MALVEAALRLLESRSPAELSLRSVARLVGVSPNAPYRHFDSKDALLAAVAEEGFRRLTAVTAAAKGSPRKRLGQMAAAYVRFATEHPRLYGLMFGPVLKGWERHAGLVAAGDASFAVVVEAVAAATDTDPTHASRDAILAWSAVHGYAMLAIDGHLGCSPAKQLPSPEELVRIVSAR
jgi:AcrR family transcriptional regulator